VSKRKTKKSDNKTSLPPVVRPKAASESIAETTAETPTDAATETKSDGLPETPSNTPRAQATAADVLIVGGGLAGGLTAMTFAKLRPEKSFILLESSDRLGGDHTWSFHSSDVPTWALEELRPFISRSWNEHSVVFPRFERTLSGAYHSIRSTDFHRALANRLGDRVRFNAKVVSLNESSVSLESGETLEAPLVLDARGTKELPPARLNGYQKFIGLDLKLDGPHGLQAPVIMDANCPQLDGFRFFYLLPWDETRLLIEETFYSDTPDLIEERIRRSIKSYAERRGWKIAKIEREERGVLPIPMTSSLISSCTNGEALAIGARGGYFHSTTGYSLADAIRIAEFLAGIPDMPKVTQFTTVKCRELLLRFRRPWLSRQRFYRLLNRMLFYAAEPGLRYTVLQRFYELPQDLIERFYSGRSTWRDRVRVLSGKPPVPVSRALKNLTERTVLDRAGL
jgi:lycopene beta-cyclase